MSKQVAKKFRLVADDNGYADHKFVWLDEAGKIMTGKIPSLIQIGGQGLTNTQGEQRGAYDHNGTDYICNPAVTDPVDLRNSDYPTSVANRVLFTHGLARFGLLGQPLKAAVTLPFRDYFNNDGSRNDQLRENAAQNFSTADVRVVGSDAQPDVKQVDVYAEALSAFFDWAIDDRGEMTPRYDEMVDTNGSILIVDIGGSTTDLAALTMVEGELQIQHSKSGTITHGVLDVKKSLSHRILKTMQVEGIDSARGHAVSLPPRLVDTVLEKGSTTYAQRRWDFTQERNDAIKAPAERIIANVKSTAGNLNDYMCILFIGGGGIVMREHMRREFANAEFGDEFSNARGALKFLRSRVEGAGE